MKTLVLAALIFCAAPAWADCPTNTGNDASLFLDKAAYQSLNPGDILRVYDGDLCVGKKTITAEDTGLAYPVVVWGNGEITEEVDGATPGNPLRITIEKKSTTTLLDTEGVFADNLDYAADRLYSVTTAVFDTTTARLMAELNAEIDALGAEIDTAYAIADFLQAELIAETARGDSLQIIVDDQRVNITDLQSQVVAANATIDSLQVIIDNTPDCTQCQADLEAAQQQIAEYQAEILSLNAELATAMDKLRQIAQIANSNKGKYRAILEVLYP